MPSNKALSFSSTPIRKAADDSQPHFNFEFSRTIDIKQPSPSVNPVTNHGSIQVISDLLVE